jgi:hypothetical protein
MNYKINICLFILLLFVFILGTNILQFESEGLTTIEPPSGSEVPPTTPPSTPGTEVPPIDQNLNNSFNKYYDNYNHFNKTSFPTIFYGDNESKVILDIKTQTLYQIDSSGIITQYNSLIKMPIDDLTKISFYSENGSRATIKSVNNIFIEIIDTNANVKIYKVDYVPNTPLQDNINNSPTTYYGSTGEQVPPISVIKEFNEYDNSDLYILKSKIVPPICPPATKIQVIHDTPVSQKPQPVNQTHLNYQENHNTPVIKCQNNTNEFTGNLSQTPSQYKPHLTSYATSQIEGNKFNKFKSVNSINSEFTPIPVLNSFHSFGK